MKEVLLESVKGFSQQCLQLQLEDFLNKSWSIFGEIAWNNSESESEVSTKKNLQFFFQKSAKEFMQNLRNTGKIFWDFLDLHQNSFTLPRNVAEITFWIHSDYKALQNIFSLLSTIFFEYFSKIPRRNFRRIFTGAPEGFWSSVLPE